MSAQESSLLLQIARDWLIQYSRFKTLDPELMKELQVRLKDFEIVPIPRELMRILCVADPSPEAVTAARERSQAAVQGAIGGLAAEINAMPELHGKAQGIDVAHIVRQIGAALEAGDINAMLEYVSPDYRDVHGRGWEDLKALFLDLIRGTESRRFMLMDIRIIEQVVGAIVAAIEVGWERQLKGVCEGFEGEVVQLVIRVKRNEQGQWLLLEAWAN